MSATSRGHEQTLPKGPALPRGKVLAERLTYDGQKFDIPGGQTNWREPARCTAYRETYEETGYLVAPRELLAIVRTRGPLWRCGGRASFILPSFVALIIPPPV